MPLIRLDANAHTILKNHVKELLRQDGIEKPDYSDCIRWLYKKVNTNAGGKE